MTRSGRVIAALALSIAVGLALTLASYDFAIRRGSIPDPGVASTIEVRGWPIGYAWELVQPVAEPGVRIRFETQWLPSFLDDAWPIERWAGLYFTFDWVLFSATCAAALAAGSFFLGRLSARDNRVP